MIVIAILIILFIYVAVGSYYMLRRISKLSDIMDEYDDRITSEGRFDSVEQSQNEYEKN